MKSDLHTDGLVHLAVLGTGEYKTGWRWGSNLSVTATKGRLHFEGNLPVEEQGTGMRIQINYQTELS